jgi:CPA2 family monovalent cation:H+ antiporter-2
VDGSEESPDTGSSVADTYQSLHIDTTTGTIILVRIPVAIVVTTNLVLTAGIFLTVLVVGGLIAVRIGHSVIPAYILVGVLIGPYAPSIGGVSLTVVDSTEFVQLLADLGVVLLLFFVGLELSVSSLIQKRAQFLRAGAIDVGISFPLGILVGLLFGFSLFESLFVGLIVFNSSTVITAKSLLDMEWIVNPESEAILGVIVIEDVLTAAVFAILSAVLLGAAEVGALGRTLGQAAAVLVLLTLFAYYGGEWLDRFFNIQSSELFLLSVLGVTTFVAGFGLAAGVSDAIVAFLVGLAFGQTSHVERIENLIAPSRDFFAAVFFFVIGLQTDPRLVSSVAGFVLVAVFVTVLGQIGSGFLAARSFGLSVEQASRMATALVPRGEFSLVIAAFLVTAGTTDTLRATIPAFTVGYVLLTSILGTILMRNAHLVERVASGYYSRTTSRAASN